MTISDEVRKLYADAFERGIYVREWPSEVGFMAFASSYDKLNKAGFRTKEAKSKMKLMDCNVFMAFGGGESREESIENAIEAFRRSENW